MRLIFEILLVSMLVAGVVVAFFGEKKPKKTNGNPPDKKPQRFSRDLVAMTTWPPPGRKVLPKNKRKVPRWAD